jgi:hypothetical protein
MDEALHESIETLVISPLSDSIVEVGRLASVLDAKLTLALAAFDRSGDWQLDGSASMTAWVRNHLGWTNQRAARVLRIGRRLLDLPVSTDAWIAGDLTDGQIEVIVANVTERRAGLWSEHEGEIVPLLRPLDLQATATAMQSWAAKADAILEIPEPPDEPPASATHVTTLDGRGYLKSSFEAESNEVVKTALRLAQSDDHEVPLSERLGEALVGICRHYLDHQDAKLGGRHRPHLNVVVTEEVLRHEQPGRTLTGTPLPGLVIRKIACDAAIHRVITDGLGSILDYGRSTRTIPPAVYTSLVLRDWGCRFPGCDRPPEWCEGHHVIHWEDGGPTNLGNLVLLCSKHHHVVHHRDWHLELKPDGTVVVTEPTGRRRTSDPPGSTAAA